MKRRSKTHDYRRIRGDSGQQRRIRLVGLILGVVAFFPVAMQLYSLMVVQYDAYAAKALSNQSRTTTVTGTRGTIYDCNMNILAASKTVENVYLAPRELSQSRADISDIAANLSEILGVDAEKIEKLAKDKSLRYHLVAGSVEADAAARVRAYINENEIAGIHLEPSSRRYYPYGSLAAQVIGFTNASNEGAEGIEASYDEYLSGEVSRVITTKGNNEMDMPYSVERFLSGTQGASIVTTIDVTVQACLEEKMQQAIAMYDVRNGAFGMVMDVDTGAILAMATLGSYDPNEYLEIGDPDVAAELEKLKQDYLMLDDSSEAYTEAKTAYREALVAARLKQWRNRCLSDGYEPGSTFKVLTLAAAIDSGSVSLNNTFYCGGAEQIPGRSQLLHCWKSVGHGSQTTAQALQNSCNLAFAHIGLTLGGDTFYEYIKNFGVLEKTGIDLQGESGGVFFSKELITNTDKWGTASLTSASFGQTFKLTPVQLVRAIASVVNGGYLLEPYVVAEAFDGEGGSIYRQERTVIRRVISQETSQIMCKLLESVVSEGTAKNATVSGYSVGGKTGTSEKIDIFDENGQRVQDKIVSFVGIAPMDDPRYIILIALDTPSRETGIYISGGVMAAPTVGAVLEEILPYLGVDTVEDTALVPVPDLTGVTAREAKAALEELGLGISLSGEEEFVTGQLPAAGQTLPVGSEVLVYLSETLPNGTVQVPDFSGMTVARAAQTAQETGLYLQTTGNPDLTLALTVLSQDIPAGTVVDRGTVVTLKFTDPTAKD